MKKKLLGILSLVLCLGMLLTSCSKGGKSFKDMAVDPYVNENPVLTAFVEDKVFDGEDVQMIVRDTFNGRYVLFNNVAAEECEAYIALYDAKDSKVIKSWNKPVTQDENNNPVSYTDIANGIYGTIDIDGEAIAFYVAYKHFDAEENKTTYTYTLYNLDGSEVYTEDIYNIYDFSIDANDYDIVGNNLFINGCQYKIGAELTKVESYNKFSYLPGKSEDDFDYVSEKYLYHEVNNSVVIYDFDFNVVGTYNLPVADEGTFVILENGNIFFSGMRALPDDAGKYDFAGMNPSNPFSPFTKFKIINEIYNVEKDKVIELDFDNKLVIPMEPLHADDEIYNVFGGKVKNRVEVHEIEDQQVNPTVKYMAMDNEGNLSEIPEIVPNQSEIYSSGIAGHYIVIDMMGNKYFVDGNGKVLGDYDSVIGSIDIDLELGNIMNDSYFISDDVIYDWNLNKVADKPEGYELIDILANGFMFGSITEDEVAAGEDQTYTATVFIFKNGVFTEIASCKSDQNYDPIDDYFVIKNPCNQLFIIGTMTLNQITGDVENLKITIFNELGNSLKEYTYATENESPSFDMAIEAEDGSYVLLYSVDGTVYKVAAAAQSVGA